MNKMRPEISQEPDLKISRQLAKTEKSMYEEFYYLIKKKNDIIEITSNHGGNSCSDVLYLSYENALWMINKLRPMSFNELTNNLTFDVNELENIVNENEVLTIESCFVDRGNCWFDITSYWDNKKFKIGFMTLPFSIIKQFEDKFYFKEFVYPFLDELEKYLPDDYKAKVIHQKGE